MTDTKAVEMTTLTPAPPPYPDSTGQPSSHPPQPDPAQAPKPSDAPPPPPPQLALSEAAQIGERYRAELFAQCAQGKHLRTTKYGVCGIITAVVLFPIGLICLFADAHDQCERCGVMMK